MIEDFIQRLIRSDLFSFHRKGFWGKKRGKNSRFAKLRNQGLQNCFEICSRFAPNVKLKLFRNRIEVGKLYCTRILLNSPETETRDSSGALRLGSRL